MGHSEHKEMAPTSVNCVVLTVSDTRKEDMDSSGATIKRMLEENSHRVINYGIVKDDIETIRISIEKGLTNPETQAIILNGGTGISKRDSTYEVVDAMMEKKITGFGEIFRYLSYEEIGSAAIMSRAIAGTCRGKIIISIPGSQSAVRLAMEFLIIPELSHMVYEINR